MTVGRCRSRRSCARLTVPRPAKLLPGRQFIHEGGAGAAHRPVPHSRLLAPTLGKERAEAREPLDIVCPAVGASPGKEGGVYHILSAQGQTQFAAGEQAEQARRTRASPSGELSL